MEQRLSPLSFPVPNAQRRGGEVLLLGEHLAGRLGGVARVHRLLERRPSGDVEIATYLREVAEDAIATAGAAASTKLVFTGNNGRVGREAALSFGLIVRELMANSLNFAHPTRVGGVIGLSCRVSARTLTLRLFDDGVGLPEGLDPVEDGGAGFRLVRNLARQLGAIVSFDSGALGFLFQLRWRMP
jgi:two-component sensor histidine kinase